MNPLLHALATGVLLASPTTGEGRASLPSSFQGIWDVSDAACRDPDSNYRLHLSKTAMWTTHQEEGDTTILHETYAPYHTEVTVKYLYQRPSSDLSGWEHFRFVLDDSGDQLFVEALPVIGKSFNFFRRFYVRCSALEKEAAQ